LCSFERWLGHGLAGGLGCLRVLPIEGGANLVVAETGPMMSQDLVRGLRVIRGCIRNIVGEEQ